MQITRLYSRVPVIQDLLNRVIVWAFTLATCRNQHFLRLHWRTRL